MKLIRLIISKVALITVTHAIAEVPSRVLQDYGKLPLQFEANAGQVDPHVRFLSRNGNSTLFLSPDEAVLSLHNRDTAAVLRMRFDGRGTDATLTGDGPLPGLVNYFRGNDPSKWHANVATYAKVRYNHLYPGVDLLFYGNQRALEYDFVVAPGADAGVIRLSIEGADETRVDSSTGDLVLKNGGQETRFRKPVLYQTAGNGRDRVEIAGRFVASGNHVTFETGVYDHARALVIDPVMAYSTYVGGSDIDIPTGMAIDSKGEVFLTGYTCSANFPVSGTAVQPVHGPNPVGEACSFNGPTLFDADAFVTKLNAAGTAIVYSTYLGGSYQEVSRGLAVDKAGNAYVGGLTYSPDFPVTANAAQPLCAPIRSYDGNCNFTVVTSCGPNLNYGAFITKLNATGSALLYSSFFGGSGSTNTSEVALDSSGNLYLDANVTTAPSYFLCQSGPLNGQQLLTAFLYPTTTNAYDPGNGYGTVNTGTRYTIFYPTLAKFDINFNLVYSTIFDATTRPGFDYVYGLAVDGKGKAYLTGTTDNANLPVTTGVVKPTCTACAASSGNAWVAAFDATKSGSASLVYSTYLGGSGATNATDIGYAIAADAGGNAYITGSTVSDDFPTTKGVYQAVNPKLGCGGAFTPAFVTKLNPTATKYLYSTYVGGTQCGFSSSEAAFAIAVDRSGNAYFTGFDTDPSFPAVNAVQSYPGGGASFVSELDSKGQHLLFSTPLGGVGGGTQDSGNGIAADSSGNVYIAGATNSRSFPTTTGAFQAAYQGGASDGYVSKIAILEADLGVTNSAPTNGN